MQAELRFFWSLLWCAVVSAHRNNFINLAKAVAYSSLLCFFPLLTSIAAILVQVKADEISALIARFVFEMVPPGTEDLVHNQFAVRGSRPVYLLVTAGLVSLWAASGAIGGLIQGFDTTYGVTKRRGFLKETLLAIGLVLLSAVPFLGASGLMVFGRQIERATIGRLLSSLGWHEAAWWSAAGLLARYLAAIGAVSVTAAMLYFAGPNRRQRWRAVWPGAILATSLWLIATLGFAWYVRNLANYNVVYGSVGTSIALLVWMYLLSAIALLGAEFNAQLERRRRGIQANAGL